MPGGQARLQGSNGSEVVMGNAWKAGRVGPSKLGEDRGRPGVVTDPKAGVAVKK